MSFTYLPIRLYPTCSPRDHRYLTERCKACVRLLTLKNHQFVDHGDSPNVKRIVVTSSCGAIMAPPAKPTVFSEKDWNIDSFEDLEKNGVNALTMSKYRVSKTLAERGLSPFRPRCIMANMAVAAWEFYEKNKANIGWDLVVINPPFVSFYHVYSLSLTYLIPF